MALDRIVIGTTWGVGIAHDTKRRVAPRWERIRGRELGMKRGMTGAGLERAIAALAAAHPEYVVRES